MIASRSIVRGRPIFAFGFVLVAMPPCSTLTLGNRKREVRARQARTECYDLLDSSHATRCYDFGETSHDLECYELGET